MKVTVRLPLTAVRVGTIRIPDDAANDIANFLDENPEYLDDIIENGRLENEQMSLLDAQIEPE